MEEIDIVICLKKRNQKLSKKKTKNKPKKKKCLVKLIKAESLNLIKNA